MGNFIWEAIGEVFLLLFAIDGIVIGTLVFRFISFLFGDGPFARFFKLLLGCETGGVYFCLCIIFVYIELYSTNLVLFIFIIFTPISLAVVYGMYKYMFNCRD